MLLEATAEPAVMAELDRTLHLADGVLRHKVIRLARPPPRASPPGPPRLPSPEQFPDGGVLSRRRDGCNSTRTDANGA